MADYSKFSKHADLYIGPCINIDFVGFNIIFTVTMERLPLLTLDIIDQIYSNVEFYYRSNLI